MAEQHIEHIPSSAKPSPGHLEVVYKKYAEKIYSYYSFILGQENARTQLSLFTHELQALLPLFPYTQNEEILVFNIAYQNLQKFSGSLNKNIGKLSIKNASCLFFRDHLDFSCTDIASILSLSVGSVRILILNSRKNLYSLVHEESFPSHLDPIDTKTQKKPDLEPLLYTMEKIEDMEPGQLKNQGNWGSRTERYLQLKSFSQSHFKSMGLVLPEALHAMPLSPIILRHGNKTVFNWSAAPWYVRILIEGLFTTSLVLGLVISIPKLKSAYELWQEKRMDLSGLAELAASLTRLRSEPQPVPVAQNYGPETPLDTPNDTLPGKTTISSEFPEKESQKAASHKSYRILVKTDSPDTNKEHLIQFLQKIEAAASEGSSTALNGTDLPGGILFDVYVPIKNYKDLLSQLGRFGEMKVIITQSHSRMVPGKARMKIWLQRI